MIEEVFIQVGKDGEFLNTALFSAARGFYLRGRHVTRATADEIDAMEARHEVLVFGGVEVVRPYLAKLGVEPEPIDYPEPLFPFMKRQVQRSTLKEIRGRFKESGPPVFIKPVQHKEFAGHLVSCFRDLLRTAEVDADAEIYLIEPIDFRSEWRFYVERGNMVGVDHYKGHPLWFPEQEEVNAALQAWGDQAPAAYGIDFGVGAEGQTYLVEVNDMVAMGSYGLDPALYARLIETRWKELTAERRLSAQVPEYGIA